MKLLIDLSRLVCKYPNYFQPVQFGLGVFSQKRSNVDPIGQPSLRKGSCKNHVGTTVFQIDRDLSELVPIRLNLSKVVVTCPNLSGLKKVSFRQALRKIILLLGLVHTPFDIYCLF